MSVWRVGRGEVECQLGGGGGGGGGKGGKVECGFGRRWKRWERERVEGDVV